MPIHLPTNETAQPHLQSANGASCLNGHAHIHMRNGQRSSNISQSRRLLEQWSLRFDLFHEVRNGVAHLGGHLVVRTVTNGTGVAASSEGKEMRVLKSHRELKNSLASYNEVKEVRVLNQIERKDPNESVAV